MMDNFGNGNYTASGEVQSERDANAAGYEPSPSGGVA